MRRWLPKRRMLSLHQLRCVDGGEMAGHAVLEEHEAPVSASIELAEQREVEFGLDRCGWFGLVCGSGGPGIACVSGRFGIIGSTNLFGAVDRLDRFGAASKSDRRGASCGGSLRGASANCSNFGALAARRLGVELPRFVDDYAHSAVTTARWEIVVARIRHRRILRFRNRRVLEKICIPARGLALVGFPKPRKAIAEREVLAPRVNGCLARSHDHS